MDPEVRRITELQEITEQENRARFDRLIHYLVKVAIVLAVLAGILYLGRSRASENRVYSPITGHKNVRYNAPNEVKIDSPAVNSHENAILGPVQLLPASPLIPFYSTDLLQIYNAAVALNPNPYNPASLCTPTIPFSSTDLWQIYCAIENDTGLKQKDTSVMGSYNILKAISGQKITLSADTSLSPTKLATQGYAQRNFFKDSTQESNLFLGTGSTHSVPSFRPIYQVQLRNHVDSLLNMNSAITGNTAYPLEFQSTTHLYGPSTSITYNPVATELYMASVGTSNSFIEMQSAANNYCLLSGSGFLNYETGSGGSPSNNFQIEDGSKSVITITQGLLTGIGNTLTPSGAGYLQTEAGGQTRQIAKVGGTVYQELTTKGSADIVSDVLIYSDSLTPHLLNNNGDGIHEVFRGNVSAGAANKSLIIKFGTFGNLSDTAIDSIVFSISAGVQNFLGDIYLTRTDSTHADISVALPGVNPVPNANAMNITKFRGLPISWTTKRYYVDIAVYGGGTLNDIQLFWNKGFWYSSN